jgi:ACR3 family arsenite efflux pump ArsB
MRNAVLRILVFAIAVYFLVNAITNDETAWAVILAVLLVALSPFYALKIRGDLRSRQSGRH